MRHSGQRIAVFTVVLITAALAATVAFGQIPDSDGVIHACYHTGNGGIRVVNDGTECSSGESPLDWYQVGATGGQGPQGPAGPAGADGADGPQGLQGLPGADVLLAKASLGQTSPHSTRVVCGLRAGGRLDRASVVLAATGSASAQTADLMLSRVLPDPGAAQVRCRYYLSGRQRKPNVRAA